ncbi:hypothetical protein [Actinoplanes sp. L3-i22]|uniref:hypothetical protein n=1 Tax=Actinoplanes sp. L3-i22 TaxID=2836373 RepID=UPI001C785DDC|nr:hypothetical protein [Actinoplanes sp. L3-i22]BCY11781.1 hypothetical protein L3i22_068690 [Actinoplanes sp. L3-i22]
MILGRWRLAMPFIVFSLLLLAASAGGLWLYWDLDSPIRRALTAFMCLMLGLAVYVSFSIALDRKSDGIPWWRMGVVVLFIALTTGVAWVRTMV